MDVRPIVARTLGRFATAVADVVLPRTCAVTGAPLSEGTERLIPGILDAVVEVLPPAAFSDELMAGLARHHDATTMLIDEAHAMWEASDEVMKVIHGIKYGGRKKLAYHVGVAVGRMLVLRGVQAAALVPVPIHTARRRERGYNQAECIAHGMAVAMQVPIINSMLARKRYTGTQTALGAAARRSNLEGSIIATVVPAMVGATVIVVDDVLTTGTTINTCAWALKQEGIGRVLAATVAAA
jgi:ComF family protein